MMTSPEVRAQLDWLEQHLALCAQCGREFACAHPSRAKYCSATCRVDAARERARKRKAEPVDQALSALQARGGGRKTANTGNPTG